MKFLAVNVFMLSIFILLLVFAYFVIVGVMNYIEKGKKSNIQTSDENLTLEEHKDQTIDLPINKESPELEKIKNLAEETGFSEEEIRNAMTEEFNKDQL